MEKSGDALKTIGEMSKQLGVQPHILRYWEEQFPQLNPLKRAGGRRYYRSEDALLLHEIHRLIYTEAFTIKGAKKYLHDAKKSDQIVSSDSRPASLTMAEEKLSSFGSVDNNKTGLSDQVRVELQSIADTLRRALSS